MKSFLIASMLMSAAICIMADSFVVNGNTYEIRTNADGTNSDEVNLVGQVVSKLLTTGDTVSYDGNVYKIVGVRTTDFAAYSPSWGASNLMHIGKYVREFPIQCKNWSFEVDAENDFFESYGKALFRKGRKELLLMPKDQGAYSSSLDAVFGMYGTEADTVFDKIEIIGDYCFCNIRIQAGKRPYFLPKAITRIGKAAFYDADYLHGKDISISGNVKFIGDDAFYKVLFSSVTLNEGIDSIGSRAFYQSANSSYTLPSTLKYIGYGALGTKVNSCSVNCLATIPPEIQDGKTIVYHCISHDDRNDMSNDVLFVLPGYVDVYAAAPGWNKFGSIVEIGASQCAKPTITPIGNKITFQCATPGAIITSKVTSRDNVENEGATEQVISGIYDVTAYATRTGFIKSEVATATIVWNSSSLVTSTDSDPVATERTSAIIYYEPGKIYIHSLEEEEDIKAYTVEGHPIELSRGSENRYYIEVEPGKMVIFKVGNRTVKVFAK